MRRNHMAIIHVNDETFEKEVQSSDTILVDFYADWCGPCRAMAPILEELDEDRTEVKILKVNVDEAPKVSQQFGIMSIPTLIVFKGGKETAKRVGLCSKEEIINLIHQ